MSSGVCHVQTQIQEQRVLGSNQKCAMRAPVLQAIEELARTSRTRTNLQDEYEVY
jgi:hypothetical protein